jgi:hypothetical protein
MPIIHENFLHLVQYITRHTQTDNININRSIKKFIFLFLHNCEIS